MKVVIIGGGLVGSLSAVFFGQRGHQVELYEYRQDPRKTPLTVGRSINLALSERGRRALRTVGLEAAVLKKAVPMNGRMIHGTDGRQSSIAYDPVHNNCIYSVGRKLLNEVLLDESSKLENVHLNFEKKVIKVDPSGELPHFRRSDPLVRAVHIPHTLSGRVQDHDPDICIRFASFGHLTSEISPSFPFQLSQACAKSKNAGTENVAADLIVGADGAYSAVRRDLMKSTPINFSQTYIDHGYLELSIPPHNTHKMAPNHLHIWPRGEFMMIALPNHDTSWTVTLFMPLHVFESLQTPAQVLEFFETHFKDSVDVIGSENLTNTFMKSEPSRLVSIKCSRYHGSKVVIIGDAAHAMVPFYGQGMNAGFEDCTILDDLLHNHGHSPASALEIFSESRNPDAEAICDLAMYNYVEMRDLVNRRSFLLRKVVDNFLYRAINDRWVPLYQSVTFSNMNYRRCLKNKKWQDHVVMRTCFSAIALIGTLLMFFFFSKAIPFQSSAAPIDEYCRVP